MRHSHDSLIFDFETNHNKSRNTNFSHLQPKQLVWNKIGRTVQRQTLCGRHTRVGRGRIPHHLIYLRCLIYISALDFDTFMIAREYPISHSTFKSAFNSISLNTTKYNPLLSSSRSSRSNRRTSSRQAHCPGRRTAGRRTGCGSLNHTRLTHDLTCGIKYDIHQSIKRTIAVLFLRQSIAETLRYACKGHVGEVVADDSVDCLAGRIGDGLHDVA